MEERGEPGEWEIGLVVLRRLGLWRAAVVVCRRLWVAEWMNAWPSLFEARTNSETYVVGS